MESKIVFKGDATSVTKTVESIKLKCNQVGKSIKGSLNNGLSSVTSSLGNIQAMAGSASSGLASMGGNLAKLGPIGVVAGAAIASIGAGIANSQKLSDLFAKKWEQIKSLFGVIGKALGELFQGNFSEAWDIVTNGMSAAYGAAGKYADALDALGTNTITWQQQQSRLNRDIAEQESIIKDTTKSINERVAAQKKLKELQEEYATAANKQITLENNIADAYIEKLLAESGQSEKFNDEEKQRLKDYLTAVDGTIDDMEKLGGKWGSVYDKISDSEYQQFATYYSTARATQQSVSDMIKSTNKVINQSLKDTDANTKNTAEQYAQGTIGAIKKQIQELEKAQLNMVFKSAEWENAEKTKQELLSRITPDEPVKLEVQFDDGTIGAIKQQIAQLNKELENTVYGSESYVALKEKIDALNESITDTNNNLTTTTNKAEGVSNMFGSASGAMSSFASESREAAIAQKSLAIAEQLAAMASAIHTASKGDPYTVAARIIAAGGAIVAAFASMASAKFAGGGIVSGSHYAGDSQLVRVNSGEMILNSSQQNKLWNALSNGNLGGGSSREISFRLRGTDIEGVMHNTQKIQNRMK